jgi:hypothetical protein
MNRRCRIYLEMAERADAFSVGHPDTDPGYNIMAGKLTQLIEQGHGMAVQQHQARSNVHRAAERKRELRREIMTGPIAHMAAVGKFASAEQHELGMIFVFKPNSESYLEFRTIIGTMAATAQTHKEVLIRHGLSEPILEQLIHLLDEFDAAIDLGDSGRIAAVGATQRLNKLATEIARVVRVMDGRIQQRFRNDHEHLSRWISASTVLGRRRRGSSSTPPEDTPTSLKDSPPPTQPPDVRPAA